MANILLKKGVAKISDFGFASFLEFGNKYADYLERKGSPLYMAPQILRGIKYSSKCDVWSVGIMIYEMLFGVGNTPWKGLDNFQLLQNI